MYLSLSCSFSRFPNSTLLVWKTPPLLSEMFETVAVRVSLPRALYRITEYYSTPTMMGGKHNIFGRRIAQARNNAWIMTGRANVAEPVSGRRSCPHFLKWMRLRGSHYSQDSGVAFLNEAKGKAAECVCGKDCSDMQGLDERCCVRVVNLHQFTPSLFRHGNGKKRGVWANSDTALIKPRRKSRRWDNWLTV